MAQGYYTLQEAAQALSMSVDELKQMAQKGQIRSFQDRGTLRFRVQDIQEMARSRGASSDGDLALGDASLPKSSSTPKSSAKKQPASAPKSPAKHAKAPDVFQFNFEDSEDDSVDLGADLLAGKGSSKGKPGSKTKKATTPTGSDSDVRLVPDGNDISFSVPKPPKKTPDSDVKVPSDPMKPKSGSSASTPSSGKRKSQLAVDSGTIPLAKTGDSKPQSPRQGQTPQPADSGVRLVPMDSDSDVKLVGASDEVDLSEGPTAQSDSNVRLEKVSLPPADSAEGSMHLTEEINLDEEIQKQQERDKDKPSTKLKAKSELKLPPAASPFELSDSDLELPSELKSKSGPKTPKKAEASDSSDFELTASAKKDDTSSEFDVSSKESKDGSSDFDLTPAADGSEDFNLESSDQEQVLHDEVTELTTSKSGINLQNPVDSGISLEDQADLEGSDFDLSLEADDTPKPQKSAAAEDSSEFELKVGDTPRPAKKAASDSDDIDLSLNAEDESADKESSEFDLSLDASDEGQVSSDSSEFELTLDDSGDMRIEEDEAPQVKKKGGGEDEQDIFDTDFEVPALDESDDATVADSELESSDFDIALDDSDLAAEEESGSQVVALDEEGEAATVADDDAAVVDDVEVEEESSDFADLDQDVEVEEEDVEVEEETATKTRVKTKVVVEEKLIPPAEWGALPVVFMLPCVIIMFLVGILGFEAVQASAGIRPPGPLTRAVASAFGEKMELPR